LKLEDAQAKQWEVLGFEPTYEELKPPPSSSLSVKAIAF